MSYFLSIYSRNLRFSETLRIGNIIVCQITEFDYERGPRLDCRGPKKHQEQIKNDQNELFFVYTVKKHQIFGNFDKQNIIVCQNTGYRYERGPQLACRGPKNKKKVKKKSFFFGYTVMKHRISNSRTLLMQIALYTRIQTLKIEVARAWQQYKTIQCM